MKISVDKNNPNYRPDATAFTVYLDGKLLEHCVTADDKLGEAWIYQQDKHGIFILNKEKTEILQEKVTGEIKIKGYWIKEI